MKKNELKVYINGEQRSIDLRNSSIADKKIVRLEAVSKDGTTWLEQDYFYDNLKSLAKKEAIISSSKTTYRDLKTDSRVIDLDTTLYKFDVKKGKGEYEVINVIVTNSVISEKHKHILDSISKKGNTIKKMNTHKKLAIALAAFTIVTTSYAAGLTKEPIDKAIGTVITTVDDKMVYDTFKDFSFGQKALQDENRYLRAQNLPEKNIFGETDPKNYDVTVKLYNLFYKRLVEEPRDANIDDLWDKFWATNANEINEAFTTLEKKIILNDYSMQSDAYKAVKEEINLQEGKSK